jgi:RNA polymerase sigma-70 factor (ECF subfamily)
MYRTAYHFVGRRSDAEDVTQEACVKLVQHLGSYRFEAPFRAWVGSIVVNAARDFLRAKARKAAHEAPLFDDLEIADHGDPEQLASARQALRAISRLPEDVRAAVVLVFCDGLSHAEAGMVLGCAESTVSWRVHEARKRLRAEGEGNDRTRPRHAPKHSTA